MSGLRSHSWKRFLQAPDGEVLQELYIPALAQAVRYDRCCAYFHSSILAAAARGFGAFIGRLLAMGERVHRPAIRLLVNEELSREDVQAIIERHDTSALERRLLSRLTRPEDALQRQRLQMLAWLAKEGYLQVRVGIMRTGEGILHAKFGIVEDEAGDRLVFRGSGNETAQALFANLEQLEVSLSWQDAEGCEYYHEEFERLWRNEHPYVFTLPLPEAVQQRLVRYAPQEPPMQEPRVDMERLRALMRWQFIREALYLPNGASACDATAPVDLWPHQRYVVHETASAYPDGRLLCDEVGLGKTIEAVIVLRRLLMGRGVKRVLILVPAGLVKPWQEELRQKAGLLVPRYERAGRLVYPDGKEQPTDLPTALREPILLMSREFARMETQKVEILRSAAWDLVVLDESHAARRAEQQEGEFNRGNLLLQLLRDLQLEGKARGLLLLSATPMQIAPWEPWDLLAVLGEGGLWLSGFEMVRGYYQAIELLSEGTPTEPAMAPAAALIASDDRLREPPYPRVNLRDAESVRTALVYHLHQAQRWQSWLRRHSPLAQRMHRNTRRTLRDYYQRRMLDSPPPRRLIEDRRIDYATDAERELYERITEYIDSRFEQLEREQRGKGFVMTVYRRRAVSSFAALRCSLQRRRDVLLRALQRQAVAEWKIEEEELDWRDLDDAELDTVARLGSISPGIPASPKELSQEAQQVSELIQMIDNLHGTDSKRDAFLHALHDVAADGRPVLVFTEYTDTLCYLRDFLVGQYGKRLGCYTGAGGQVWDGTEWRAVSGGEVAERLRQGQLDVLLCTDAASEGLNLQAAGALINYDLPWNPAKVEQRIGRIDRIGQRYPQIRIVNLLLRDSIDERIYSVLRQRCGLFEHFVGEMQPVLAQARRMFIGQREVDTDALQRYQADRLASEIYRIEGEARGEPDPSPPALTRQQVAQALQNLPADCGITVRQERASEGIWKVRLSSSTQYRCAVRSDLLEQYTDLHPLTPESELAERIVRKLGRAGIRLPLVLATAEREAFRVSVAYWTGSGKIEPVSSYDQLEQYLQTWDGSPAETALWRQAREQAMGEAQEQVRQMHEQVYRRWQEGLRRQVEAARYRLQRELLRLLCAADRSRDPNAVWEELSRAGGARADWLREAAQRLGYPYVWTQEQVSEARQYVRELPPQAQETLKLGATLQAALQDPRWKALDVK